MFSRFVIVAALVLAASTVRAADGSASSANSELIAGDECGNKFVPGKRYKRYCRPPLFHPLTALAAYQLKLASLQAARPPTPKLPENADIASLRNRIEQIESKIGSDTPASPAGNELNVIAPDALLDVNASYSVQVTDQCATGEPVVTVIPSTAIKKKLEKVAGNQFRLELQSKDLLGVAAVKIVVVSCLGVSKTFAAAEQDGQAMEFDIPVRSRIIETTLNVWPRDAVSKEFGEQFSRTFIVADAVVENTLDKPILVYGSSLRAQVRFLLADADVKKMFGGTAQSNPELLWKTMYGDERPLANALDFTDTYRPMSFSDVLAIFEYDREADPRQRGISALKSLGTLLTAGAVFSVGQDYLKGVAFFTGAFIPEVEKQLMWDVMLHVKNLESRSLKEVEEISPRGQLRKVVFFPRTPIENLVPFGKLYIAEITPAAIPLTAVILETTQSTTSVPGSTPAQDPPKQPPQQPPAP